MFTSNTDAPFQFNFGGNSDFPTSLPPELQDKENTEASGLTSVEVRPSLQVSLPSLPLLWRCRPLSHHLLLTLQVSPSLELDKVPITDVLYLLKVIKIIASLFCILSRLQANSEHT